MQIIHIMTSSEARVVCTLHQILGLSNKEDEMGQTCSTIAEILLRTPRHRWEGVWTEFIWLRTESSDGLLWTW